MASLLSYQSQQKTNITAKVIVLLAFELLLVTKAIVADRRLIILPDNQKVNVPLKESFSAKCKPQGDNPNSFSEVRWNGPNNDNNFRELEQRHKVIRSPIDGSAKLIFNSTITNLDDSGTYSCIASYQSTDILTNKIQIEFYAPIELKDCSEHQYVILGKSDAKISCHVTSLPGPSVEIYKDNLNIQTLLNRYGYENNDYIRISGPVQESDAGDYKMIFTLDAYGKTLERTIHVEIFKPPQIIPFNDSQPNFRGVRDQEAMLKCAATGYPPPRILWQDAKKRNVSTEGGYHVDPERGTLRIERVNEQTDDGLFECIAVNQAGESRVTVSMAVDIRPSITLFENKTVEEGGQVIFECRSNGRPTPKIEIRRNSGLAYRMGDGFFKEEQQTMDGDISVYRLYLENVYHKKVDGIHYCNSSNVAGSSERVGELRVEFKPELDGTPRTQFIRPNLNPTVICHIKAYPTPTVRWYHNNEQLVNINASIQTANYKTHVITMTPPPTILSSAEYKCVAYNKMGENFALIRTERSRPPGSVDISYRDVGPTYVALQLSVPNDGGERIRNFTYEYSGDSAIINSPMVYRNHKFRSFLNVLENRDGPYLIKNLRPRYRYSITVWAHNDVGHGEPSVILVTTHEPTRPNKPIINNKPTNYQTAAEGLVTSQYSNGYTLSWSEPESSGDNITKYIIQYSESDKYSLTTLKTIGETHFLEQLRDRPTFAQIGPLRTDSKYRIDIRAINSIGSSDPDSIMVYVPPGKSKIPEFSESTLAWLSNDQAPITISLLVVILVALMIAIDLTCCYCYQIGVAYFSQSWCCPVKTSSVVSDKNYT